MPITRRTLLSLTAAAASLPFLPYAASANARAMSVFKAAGCGCCEAWIHHLQRAGFAVTATDIDENALAWLKADNGVPEAMAGCHTGLIGGYVIEGHVPAADIERFLAEAPKAVGLAVPGMPVGSPGMEVDSAGGDYDVFMLLDGGRTEIFARYTAK